MADNIWGSPFEPDLFPEVAVKEYHFPDRKRKHEATASYGGVMRSIFSVSYNGEKNLGEVGPVKDYLIDYELLRLRSWQLYIESEIAQTVINRFVTWIISRGLKLKANPILNVLKTEGVTINTEYFNETVESRFGIFAESKASDYSRRKNLNLIARACYTNAIVGGDVLVVIRYDENTQLPNVQLIDGCHVCSPLYGDDTFAAYLKDGNCIRNGIELSPTGEHIAYYVRKNNLKFERIPAKSTASGLTTATLIYGLEYRLDNTRGLPLLAVVIETAKKLERYKEAVVGRAEEIAKVAYQVVHEAYSTGENPMAKNLAKAWNADANTDEIGRDVQGKQVADTVAATTNKQAFNMPIGSKLQILETGDGELYFKDFYGTNIDLVCAALGIPPNVAMSKYDSNFSASRAALKDWEHTIGVSRYLFGFGFYKPIYEFFLHTEILKGKVAAPGYLNAFTEKNEMVLGAYRNARFTGPNVPHIDPVKEVEAERRKLGTLADHLPLTTVEQATEALNGGDSDSNFEQFSEEISYADKLKLKAPEPKQPKPVPAGE